MPNFDGAGGILNSCTEKLGFKSTFTFKVNEVHRVFIHILFETKIVLISQLYYLNFKTKF
jgi:hypothetical protein